VQGLSYEELSDLVNDSEKSLAIWATTKDIMAYANFIRVIDLGLTVSHNDLTFERAMIFSWIKEEIDGRKTRV